MQLGTNALQCRVGIVCCGGWHGSQDTKTGQVQSRRAADLGDFGNYDVADVTRRARPQHDALNDFGVQSNHAPTLNASGRINDVGKGGTQL
jgi:hypothetical protein